ncbi:MAG: hypothetical protein KIS68_02050 [Bauldia sp.]|nr:hypothetical protein [Bauldia sp.]
MTQGAKDDWHQVIAERRLAVLPEGEVRIGIEAPVPAPGGDWQCRLHITGLSAEIIRDAVGVDGIQAIWAAMSMAASYVYASDLYRAGHLIFSRDSEPVKGSLFLPLQESLTDLVPVEGFRRYAY